MKTVQPHKITWTLLNRPYWIGILAFVLCFGILYIYIKPQTLIEIVVSIASVIGFFCLLDLYKQRLFPVAIHRIGWRIFLPLALLITVLVSVGIKQAGIHLGLTPALTEPIYFMFLLSGAIALPFSRAEREKINENATY